jgi:hypothetical protein
LLLDATGRLDRKYKDLVNATELRARLGVLLLAALVLTAAAWLRGAEYDEQYTLFLTAGVPRPAWPATVFPAGTVAAVQAGHATLTGIVRDLRATDVHPPLYFWAALGWRWVFGPGLFALRLLSVLFGLISIWLVGIIAGRCASRPALAMLLTLGCYGFVYTNAIARDFAPAEMLTLSGVTLLLGRRPVLAGVCLGAACCCNYLAVFAAAAVIASAGALLAIPACIPFLAVDTWFFAAQHAARSGQFPPFEVLPSVVRLARYQVAAAFGGLPLYADGAWRVVLEAGVALLTLALLASMARVRPARWMLLAAATATPVGLLMLGAIFNNTPIELRYLSFGLPFVALLAAGSLKPRLLAVILAIQAAGIAGLMLSPRTMQPARGAATAATTLAAGTIVLVPAGNDGVGIVGAFAIEAPPDMPLLLIRPTDPIADRLAPYHRIALAMLTQDRDSTEAVAAAHAALTQPNWHRVAIRSNLEVFERGD